MTIPSTNNISVLSFTAGLILSIYSFKLVFSSNEYVKDYFEKTSVLQYDYNSLDKELKEINKRLEFHYKISDSIIKESKELYNKIDNLKISATNELIEDLNKSLDSYDEDNNNKINELKKEYEKTLSKIQLNGKESDKLALLYDQRIQENDFKLNIGLFLLLPTSMLMIIFGINGIKRESYSKSWMLSQELFKSGNFIIIVKAAV